MLKCLPAFLVSSSLLLANASEIISARGCPGENGPTFTAAFLYWKIKEDNLNLGYLVNPIGPSTSNFTPVQFDFAAKPGFRLGLGYNTCHDEWDVKFQWTEIESTLEKTVTSPTLGLQPFASLFAFDGAAELNASWTFTLNTLDAAIGRLFFAGKAFAVRPNAGIFFAWITQHERLSYYNGFTSATVFSEINAKADSRFFGAGPQFGIDLRASLGAGLHLVASTFGALPFAWFNVTNRFEVINALGANILAAKFPFQQSSLKPLVDIAVGLDWGRCFKKWFYFNLGALYEAQIWWEQNQLLRYGSFYTPGDLSMNGLTLKARFEF